MIEEFAAVFPWFFFFPGAWKPGMIVECENPCAFQTRIGSPASGPRPPSGAFSVTPRHASCRCGATEKNGLWRLRAIPARLLRPQAAAHPRPVLWRHPRVPGGRGPTRGLPPVRRREAGETPLVGGQPLLHQTLRLL